MLMPELQAERLVVLLTRLETSTVRGNVKWDKQYVLDQHNFNNQVGGDCKLSSCEQVNVGINATQGNQSIDRSITVTDVIEDNRRLFQAFGSKERARVSVLYPFPMAVRSSLSR
jgi:hypothetical protein